MQYTMKLTSEAKHHGFIETSSSNEVQLFPQKKHLGTQNMRSAKLGAKTSALEATIFF